MIQNSQLQTEIEKLVKAENLILYDVLWRQDGKMRILQISIMDENGKMDIDTCAEMSSKISDKLDELDMISYEYYLEVCSPGAERELRSEAEIEKAVGEYVYVKLINPKDGISELRGYLKEVSDTTLFMEYQEKAVKKKKEIEKVNIAIITLAVKI